MRRPTKSNSKFAEENTAVLYSPMIQSRQIEAFRAVMLTGAMTTAAEMIHVTQPAVSRLIRDLEKELGIALFRRRGNLVVPTAEAQALLGQVERSFTGLRQIQAFADDLRTGRGGSLRIAALPAMAAGFMPRFVAKFVRERPRLNIIVDGLPSPAIRDRVAGGQIDIGITAFPFQRSSITATALDDNAVVAMPVGHRMAGQEVVRADDLHDENLILVTKLRNNLHPIEAALQSVRGQQTIETPLATIACVLVSEGLGVAVVDPFSASEFLGKGVVVRPFAPSIAFGTAVINASDRSLSMIAQEFHTEFVDHARQFLQRAEYLRT
jgi:DNA-binding transcriptional LysR family regulator